MRKPKTFKIRRYSPSIWETHREHLNLAIVGGTSFLAVCVMAIGIGAASTGLPMADILVSLKSIF